MTTSQQPSKERVTLSGVSETALLTLNARAREARRRDPIIDDPMAIALVDSIDFDFAKFGPTRQDFALRARAGVVVLVNGAPGIAIAPAGHVEALLQIGIEDGRIHSIDIVGDADRLHSAILALPH